MRSNALDIGIQSADAQGIAIVVHAPMMRAKRMVDRMGFLPLDFRGRVVVDGVGCDSGVLMCV